LQCCQLAIAFEQRLRRPRPDAETVRRPRVGGSHRRRSEVDRCRCGDGVFMAARLIGRGKASGVEVDMRFYGHCRVRDGKVSYCYEHLSRGEALKAMGIEEKTAVSVTGRPSGARLSSASSFAV